MLLSIVNCFGILLFALAWLSFDHYRPWVNFHAETMAIVGIGLLLVHRGFKAGREAHLLPRQAVWVLVVALIPWIQCIFGTDVYAGDAFVLSYYFFGLAAAIYLGNAYAGDSTNKPQGLIASFYTLWFVALVSAAIGLLQWLGLQEPIGMYVVQTDFGDRAMGNLGQPNQLATLLLMGMAALLWTFEKEQIGRIGLTLGIGFLSLVLVLTQSRSGMLSSIAGVLFLTWKYRQTPSRVNKACLWVWLLVFLLAVQALPYIREVLFLGDTRHMNPLLDSARPLIWKQVISGIAQAPWFGYGWNQIPAAHAAGSLLYPGSLSYSNAHNFVLDVLAWNGLPLGLLLTILCAYWLFSRMKSARALTAVYALLVILPIAIHSMVEYPFAYAYFLLAAGLMVGMVEASHHLSRPINLKVGGMAATSVLLATFMAGGYLVYEYLLVEKDFQVVRFENLRVGQTPAGYETPSLHLLTQMSSMLQAARQEALPGMTAYELENLRKASRRFAFGSLRLRYAIALGLNGRPEEATKQFAIIRGMYGSYYHQAAISVLRQQQREKYPVLSQVVTP